MNYTEGLFRFIEKSPTPFHVIDNMKQELEEQGYKQLLEREEWKLEYGGKYYVIRNGSAMVAFRHSDTEIIRNGRADNGKGVTGIKLPTFRIRR